MAISSKIKFKNPPVDGRETSHRRGQGKHADIASQLRARPGRWALIEEAASGARTTTIVKTAHFTAYEPAGSFEAVSRGRDDGKFDIYARYVGEVA